MYDIKFSKSGTAFYHYSSWCQSFKSGQDVRKIGHNTWARYGYKVIEFIYHHSVILKVDHLNHWHYNTHGWETYTTKRRYNVLGPAYVWQKDGLWFFNDTVGHTWKYKDGMVLNVQALPIKEGPWLMS